VVNAQSQTSQSKSLTLAKAEEQCQRVHVCTVTASPLNLLHFFNHLDLQGIVKSSLLFAKVTFDNSDGLRWKIKNLDPVDGVIF
jgi:hypothetical protein